MKAQYLYAVALLVTFEAPAYAQADKSAEDEASGYTFGDIVVTAQRRSESLQKVPLAVTALDAAALTNAGVVNTQQLAAVTPSMVTNSSNGSLGVFIRGVGSRLAPPGLESSVATYVDDRWEGQTNAALVRLFDVQRIEVVEGPQGVLFGRNATGGAVRVITNKPTDLFEGNATASYGNYDTKELRGTLNIPVGPALSTRFSALYSAHDGYVKNVNPTGLRQLRDDDFLAFRGSFALEISPAVSANLSVDYWREKGSFSYGAVLLPPYDLNPLIAGGGTTGRRWDEAATANNRNSRQHEPSVAFRLDADLDAVKLSSITTYARPVSHIATDTDATSVVSSDTYDYHMRRDVWTQELQAVSNSDGPFHWLLGGYYLKEKGFIEVQIQSPVLVSAGVHNVDTTSASAFGQATYDITDRLSLILGGRYTHEKKDLSVTPNPTLPNIFGNTPFFAKTSFSQFTPRAVLQWQYSDDGMVYASYARGIKGGGFSFPAIGQPTLRPEILDSYEIGWKADLADRHVRISSSAFYYAYDDLQVSRTGTLPNGTLTILTDNAAQSTIKGFQANLQVKPVSDLTLSGGFTYLDAKYDRYPASARVFRISTPTPGNGLGTVAAAFDAAGRQMLYTPKFAGYVSGQYAFDVGSGRLSTSATLSYKSSYEFDFVIDPLMSGMRQKAYALLGARMSYDLPSTGLSVAVYGNNLTDRHYLSDASVGPQGPKGIYADPRTYGIEIGYKF